MSTHAYLYSLVTSTNTKQNMPILQSLFDWVVRVIAVWFFSELKVLRSNPSKDIKNFLSWQIKGTQDAAL